MVANNLTHRIEANANEITFTPNAVNLNIQNFAD